MSTLGQSAKESHTDTDCLTADLGLKPEIAETHNEVRYGKARVLVVGLFLAGIAALSVTGYLWRGQSTHAPQVPTISAPAQSTETIRPEATAPDRDQPSFLAQIFGFEKSSAAETQSESWLMYGMRVTLRLLLAAVLAAMLAFRPRKNMNVLRRNPYVAETEILLAVVAAALMMIVADNAARAFGIFAAASLVRFRTNIRDPKEITVLLINLAIGLATGVGRWELAVILGIFVLSTLWILEYFESQQIIRSMQLKIRTHSVADTDEALRRIFTRRNLSAEIRELNREDEEDQLGRVVYHVAVGPHVSTDQLSEEIFSSDPYNIDTVEWHQKKNVSYTYR